LAFFKKQPPPSQPKTVIGPKTTFKGALVTQAEVELLGVFEGPVRSKSALIIAQGARVKGDLTCATLLCCGAASGQASIAGLATIEETGSWDGQLKAGRLFIRKGAQLTGTLLPYTP